jgi:hypothetical protein
MALFSSISHYFQVQNLFRVVWSVSILITDISYIIKVATALCWVLADSECDWGSNSIAVILQYLTAIQMPWYLFLVMATWTPLWFYYGYVGLFLPFYHCGYTDATPPAHHAYMSTLLHLSLMTNYARGGQLARTLWAMF